METAEENGRAGRAAGRDDAKPGGGSRPGGADGAPTLVLGGTGKTGRRVAARLAARGLPVRVGSRAAAPAFDWADRATWDAALRGVAAVYVAYQPDLAMPGAVEAVRDFVDRAVRSGVGRLVLLAGRGEEEAERAEHVVRDAGVDWTILRASFFSQNFSENFLREAVLGGEVLLPVGEVGEPFVDVEDIADVAVAALAEDGHAGRLYEVTGPRLLTWAEAVAEVAAATGREIRYGRVSPEAFAAGLTADGLPAELVTLLGYLFVEVMDGRGARLGDGVQRALGREPRDFARYARAAAAAGAWAASTAAVARADMAAAR